MSVLCTAPTYLASTLFMYFCVCTARVPNPHSLVKVLCAAAVNTAMFISDHARAVKVLKEPDNPTSTETEEDKTMSLLWVCTGVTNLSKVRDPLRGCGGWRVGGGWEGVDH